MSSVRRPFVIRVQHDDPHVARNIARALVPMLRERNARVLLDGQPVAAATTVGADQAYGAQCASAASASSEQSSYGVHVLTGGRVLPGTTVTVGVSDEENGPRWLTPLPVSEEPLTASDQVMAFLEEWGFVPAAPARSVPARSATA